MSDTTGPSLDLPATMTVSATSPAGAPVSFAGSASDLVDGVTTVNCAPSSGATFPFGTTTVTCSSTDSRGNASIGSFDVTVQDATKPVVTVPDNQVTEATGPGGAAVTFPAATGADDVDGPLPTSCDHASGATFPIGATTVTCSSTDAHGNTGTAAFTVTVEDTTAPVITVPTAVVAEATSSLGAVVTYTASAHDLVDGARPMTCEPASGSQFALGATTVTCSASDTRGNTRSAAFTVTVRDTTAPAFGPAPDDITAEATSASGATVTYAVGDADDVVDGAVTPVCTPTSGATFPLGRTTVTCTATDRAGNTARQTFDVTVVDTTPPTVAVPANQVAEATSGAGAVVTFEATASDLVSGATAVTCAPPSGSTFPLGETAVTCRSTDAAGNTGAASFAVKVQDTAAPQVSVPADLDAEATGPAGAAVSYGGQSAHDTVDGPLTPSCAPPSGATYPLGPTTVTCTATDAAGNTGDNHFVVTVRDTTGPAMTVPANITVHATSAAGAAVGYSGVSAVDLVDGAVAATCDHPSGSTFPLGSTTVTCSSSDSRGNATSKSFVVTVTVSWSGVLQPVNADGSSVFKLGSTIPVKFQVTGASAGIGNLVARLYLSKINSGVAGTETEAVSTSNADVGNQFRYAGDGQYHYNLATKPLSAGTWLLRIDLGDGQDHTVRISLRK